jgi:hypothetical protein
MNTTSKTAVVAVMTLALGRRDECSDDRRSQVPLSELVGRQLRWSRRELGRAGPREREHRRTSTADASAFVCVYQ